MSEDSSKPAEGAYAVVTWSPARGIIAAIVALLVGQILAGLLVLGILTAFGMSSSASEAWSETTTGQFVLVVIAEALTLLILWQVLKKRRPSWASLGFLRNPQLGDVGRAIVACLVYFGMLIVAASLAKIVFGVDTGQEQDIGFKQVVTSSEYIMAFVSLVILPPIVEEILFRGVIFGGLRKRVSFTKAMLVTSLLFALPHALQGSGGSLLLIGAIDTFILSMALCYLREKTGNLWSSIVLHMIKNGVAYIALFVLATK
ncbi:MAG TPA: type II CAAX endopeptidase family protein [Candidatus Saccharimonadales bacterium]|nr:type II CAAX endopeptidase family protein [Candidatus Saccharimonadales bacterium]